MKGYGQFCPIAKASEILAKRWTFLVLRELILGSSRFNDLRRGVPLMSSSLLSQRLKFLEREGVVERRPAQAGSGFEYALTAAGGELEPVIMQLGEWGARWVRSRLGAEDLDVALLMWDMHRNVRPEQFPARRVVVASSSPTCRRASAAGGWSATAKRRTCASPIRASRSTCCWSPTCAR